MLKDCNVHPTIGVSDMARARQFYEDVLGLRIEKEQPEEIIYASGSSSRLSIYKAGSAGTNQSTYASWEVADVEDMAAKLKDRGVVFEHYDNMEGVTRDGDVHSWGDTKAAWFRDPDGNFLCIGDEVS